MAQARVRKVVRSRGFLLVPAAALIVHQLRYTLAYGAHADQVMAAQGHSYLNSLAPWLVLLVALGLGLFLVRVARSLGGRRDARPARSFLGLWALASVSLAAIYTVQEFVEGVFAAGHPAGMAGIVGHGGWWALAASVLAGAVCAALLRFAVLIEEAAGRLAERPALIVPPAPSRRPRPVPWSRRSPLAGSAAGRAPPLPAPAAALAR